MGRHLQGYRGCPPFKCIHTHLFHPVERCKKSRTFWRRLTLFGVVGSSFVPNKATRCCTRKCCGACLAQLQPASKHHQLRPSQRAQEGFRCHGNCAIAAMEQVTDTLQHANPSKSAGWFDLSTAVSRDRSVVAAYKLCDLGLSQIPSLVGDLPSPRPHGNEQHCKSIRMNAPRGLPHGHPRFPPSRHILDSIASSLASWRLAIHTCIYPPAFITLL